MSHLLSALTPVVLLLSVSREVEGKGFLLARHADNELKDIAATDSQLRRDLHHVANTASRFVHFDGHHGLPVTAAHQQEVLRHMWRALPQTTQNRIGANSLCYLMQRYFMQSSLLIRDLEPVSTGVTDKTCRLVSLYAESVLQGRHAFQEFSLDDATAMVAAIEDLLINSDTELLETVYSELVANWDKQMSHVAVRRTLENFMVHWLMGHDDDGIQLLLDNRTLLQDIFPHWNQLSQLAAGYVQSLAYSRAVANVLSSGFSFKEVQQMVGSITRSFGSFWQSECTRLKDLLIDLDYDEDGRVSLASFYKVGVTSEWRLGESEAYLRELGVLDETSRWRGAQVIIPNYLQAASNCIVTTQHYLVCCMNECQAIMAEIEAGIGEPIATPEQVLAVIRNMTMEDSSLEDAGKRPKLTPSLTAQLKWIATSNGGRILVHGRLFAQWLHYVFPHDCPFPHMRGSTKAMTPSEFGETYIASEEEMRSHTDNASTSNVSSFNVEEQVVSLWSAEEELIVDYAPHHFHASWADFSWSRHLAIVILATAILLLGAFGAGHHAESAGSKVLKEHF